MTWKRLLQPQILFAWDDDAGQEQRGRKSSTAWLDGARGLAAFLVYIYHFTFSYASFNRPYGSTPEDNHIFQIPLFRPIYCGGAASPLIFFVISGFAITYKSFVLMREEKTAELYQSLSSSIVRRWFRLWLPVIPISLPMIFMYQYWPYHGKVSPNRRPSLFAEVGHWSATFAESTNPFPFVGVFGIPITHLYLMQAWTLQIEFYCSIVCWVVVMAISRMSKFRRRATVLSVCCIYNMHIGSYWTTTFLFGMLLADLTVEQTYLTKERRTHAWNWLYCLLFLVGWYLIGVPDRAPPDEIPPIPRVGYEFLYAYLFPERYTAITHPVRWFHTLGGILIMYSLSQCVWLRAPCNSKIAQWFGKISFALYLVHVQLLTVFQWPLREVLHLVSPNIAIMYVLEMCLLTPVVFAASGLAWRYIDLPCLQITKWIDRKCRE